MGHPVKLSEELVLEARLAGNDAERSLAAQIEFWARIGRAMERVLRSPSLIALKRRGDARLSESVRTVDSDEGQRRTNAVLEARPFPHFEQAPGRPGFLVKIDADGTRTVGRFVNRQFQPDRG